ncbi:MAG: GDP-mannose 4,6-dehydratase, partial [Candidatus Omnitrophica bacterium]|nr:GDP-mannose 4,6-dehydratase [Candidatus Omnitrophota bacterium]
MSKSYLITGGAGFIGSNFVEYVYKNEPDAKVRVLDKLTYSGNLENLKPFESKEGFEFIHGDICDKELVKIAVKGMNIVVNFAAEVAVDRSIDEPESFLKTDIFGVYTLL